MAQESKSSPDWQSGWQDLLRIAQGYSAGDRAGAHPGKADRH